MEAYNINAMKKLNNTNMQDFLNHCEGESIVIQIKESIKLFSKSELKTVFFDKDIQAQITDKNQEVSLYDTNSTIMTFLGSDYNWYKNNESRVNDLFSTEIVEKPKKEKVKKEKLQEILVNVACANREDNVLTNIVEFAGNRKQILEFMNKEYSSRQLRSMFKAEVVFNFGYFDNEEFKDKNNWYTLEELEKAGVITVS